ncbi:MAG: thiamine phosphate synthase [Chloroflexota bacterium]|nr:thiamine phosphate synthase [Chloroflexota bacterium]
MATQSPDTETIRPLNLSVYVILDRDFTAGRSLVDVAEAAIRGGATVLQLRDKSSDIHRFYADAKEILVIARAASVPLIIDDRVDIALAIDADGIHVGEDDLPVAATRRLVGPDRFVGASAGSVAAARAAIAAGADHLGVGPVYEARTTKTDAGPPVGLTLIQTIAALQALPVVGIGGITADNAGAVIAAGAAGVAVISAVGLAPDVEAATRSLAHSIGVVLELPSRGGTDQ